MLAHTTDFHQSSVSIKLHIHLVYIQGTSLGRRSKEVSIVGRAVLIISGFTTSKPATQVTRREFTLESNPIINDNLGIEFEHIGLKASVAIAANTLGTACWWGRRSREIVTGTTNIIQQMGIHTKGAGPVYGQGHGRIDAESRNNKTTN